MNNTYDVIIIGAGASGLMCAIEAGKRGRKTCLIDHKEKPAEKLRISGGGKCNFTNTGINPSCFISQNPHFCKSALKQYTAENFILMLQKHGIKHHTKKDGQLFCDNSSLDIIYMLRDAAKKTGVETKTGITVSKVEKFDGVYKVITDNNELLSTSLVIASGGLSIPKTGASDFGYRIARQFGLKIVETQPALVPLTFGGDLKERCKQLTGLSVTAEVKCHKQKFYDGLLFTHKGLSGPVILQISSYWNNGDALHINLAPEIDAFDFLKAKKKNDPKQQIHNALAEILPKRLAQDICAYKERRDNLASLSDEKLKILAEDINNWTVTPTGTEGYKIAEVTKGGVNTDEISSKTMECKKHSGLFFTGEVLDVTGQLGGFNLQWAWSSGYVAGQNV